MSSTSGYRIGLEVIVENVKPMKFGFRKPSFKKRIAARTSLKRFARHSLGIKAPRGMDWLTNPKKAAYNRVYNRTSRGCMVVFLALGGGLVCVGFLILILM